MQIYVIEKLNGDFRIDFYSGTGFEQDRRTLHSHPYHEFSLIGAGDVTYTSNKCVDRVDNEHCFIFSAAYQLHNPYINQEKKYERYQIMFSPDFVSSFLPEYRSIFSHFMSRSAIYRVPEKTYRRMLTIMETLYDRFENTPASRTGSLEARLLVSELMLLANDVAHKNSESDIPATATYIDETVSYIREHYAEDIKLDFLASKFFVSYAKFTRDFKQAVGMTVNTFITLTRVEAAKPLLAQGYSVSSVASLVGYPGTSYFIKIFKRCTGMTPLKFQQGISYGY